MNAVQELLAIAERDYRDNLAAGDQPELARINALTCLDANAAQHAAQATALFDRRHPDIPAMTPPCLPWTCPTCGRRNGRAQYQCLCGTHAADNRPWTCKKGHENEANDYRCRTCQILRPPRQPAT